MTGTRCNDVQEYLLSAESVHVLPGEVAEHLKTCTACAAVRGKVERLDAAAKKLGGVPGSVAAADRFLAGHAPASAPARKWGWWISGAAAVIAVAAGVWAYSSLIQPRREPTVPAFAYDPAIVDRMVDWNVSLAGAPDADARGKVFASQAGVFRYAISTKQVSPEDQELVDALMDQATYLVKDESAAGALERFGKIADILSNRLAQLESRDGKGSHPRLEKLVENLQKIRDGGMQKLIDRAKAGGQLPPRVQERIDAARERMAEIRRRVQTFRERHPEGRLPNGPVPVPTPAPLPSTRERTL